MYELAQTATRETQHFCMFTRILFAPVLEVTIPGVIIIAIQLLSWFSLLVQAMDVSLSSPP